MLIQKICEGCSKLFQPKKKRTRFCSVTCFNKRQKPTKHRERTCLNCGKLFLIKNLAYDKRGHVKYCSKECNATHNRKYTFDYNYFDNIDCANKAYILGFLWSDGYNSNDEISIVLQRSDESILNSMLLELKSTNNIKHTTKNQNGKEFYYSTIRFSSRKMAALLSSYGMVKAKTNYLEFPTMIPDEYIFDFIRGYFDGDGCMYVNTNSKSYYGRFSIYSNSPKFLIELYNILIKNDIKVNIYEKTIEICNKTQINKIYTKFYKNDNCLCLNRKKDKFKKYLSNKFFI